MGLNYKVEFKSEQTIAALAARCWTLSRQHRPYTFDVMGFINGTLIAEGIDSVVHTRRRKKGNLALEFFDREFKQDDPAYVEFTSGKRNTYVTLHVDNDTWRLAQSGDSDACEILAHEVGHVLLHDHYANAFSTDGTSQKLFEGTSREDFAEWQAIAFAGHLMIPTYVVQKFPDPKILAAATNTPERLARERLKAVQMMKKYLVGLTKAIFARTASILPWSGTASQQNATPAGESSGRNKEGASKKSVDKCRAAESDSNRTDSVEIKSRSRVIRVLETPMPRQASALVP